MAKGNMFLSQARGKVGSVVFSVIKGQQVERVHNPSPANPRTNGQQAQRSLLANMTKFYKRGTQNFYKFAFEDKTVRESDFNAFARKNIMNGAYVPREFFDNENYPAIGIYTMTAGSLAHNVQVVYNGDYIIIDPGTNSITGTAQTVTIGQISAAILANSPGLQQGDLFTFVTADSSMDIQMQVGPDIPSWDIKQFYLDPADVSTVASKGFNFMSAARAGGGANRGILYLQLSGIDRTSFAALCFSRKTDSGLKVSTSTLRPSAVAECLFYWLRGEYAKQLAAASWGGNTDAVLEGGLLSNLPLITKVSLGTATEQSPFAYASMLLGSGGTNRLLAFYGADLRTTAQGGQWKADFFSANNDLEEVMGYQPTTHIEVPLTVTTEGTGSSVFYKADLPVDTPEWLQGYFVLSYNGIPFSYGTMIQEV